MRKLFTILLACCLLFVVIHPAFAAKKLTAVYVAPTFIKSTNNVRATFSGTRDAKKISYTLSYEGNGIGQGVIGSFAPAKSNVVTKNLFLGTCSGKVCIKHKNIKNITLTVTITYSNGQVVTNTYKIKA
jgi:hypothetical protein